MGDIPHLAESIREVGLLHPVVVKPDGTLIAGARRLEAAKFLGWPEIPVTVVELDDLLKGEWAENAERKDFTPSEAVAIGLALEERVRELARARQEATQLGHYKNDSAGSAETAAPKQDGAAYTETRDIVSRAVGMGHTKYEEAKAVVKAAVEDPETFVPLVEQMDRTGKVAGAYDKMTQIKHGKRPKYPPLGVKDYSGRRIAEIERMAAESHRVTDIAKEVGLTEGTVRTYMSQRSIPTVESKVGRGRRLNGDVMMEGFIESLIPPDLTIKLIYSSWDELDRNQFEKWDDSLTGVIGTLSKLRGRLRKELGNDNGND